MNLMLNAAPVQNVCVGEGGGGGGGESLWQLNVVWT